MATLASNYFTMADYAATLDPSGKPAKIIDILSQSNQIVEGMSWMEGNLPTGHKTTQTAYLPVLQSRAFNQGVASQAGRDVQIEEGLGMFESVSDIDVALAELGGNLVTTRWNQDRKFISGLTNGFASKLFYGDTAVDPSSFNGFTRRYGSTSTAFGAQMANVIDATGTGAALSSIWIITWGENATTGIFPKGSTAGLQTEDMGKIIKFNSDNTSLRVYQTRFDWKAGLLLQDWRYNVRIANINTAAGALTNWIDLINALDAGISLLPTVMGVGSYRADPTKPAGVYGGMGGRTEIYMNRTVFTALKQQLSYRKGVLLNWNEGAPRPYWDWNGVPIIISDALLSTETQATSAQPV